MTIPTDSIKLTTRASWIAVVAGVAGLLSLPACDGCNKTRVSEPIRVVVAPASGSASSSSSPETASSRPLPTSLHGKIAYQRTVDGAPRLLVSELGANGAAPPRRVVDELGGGLETVSFSRDGERLLYSRNDKGDGAIPNESLWTVGADGSGNKKLADCAHRCAIAGIAADGTVWYVDQGASLIGTIKTVSSSGGKVTSWKGNPPKGWTACGLSIALSHDRTRLLIGVDNQLGWPSCIDGGLQGLYVVTVDPASAAADRGKPLTCFTTTKAKMNLSFSDLSFNPAGDRVQFSVVDAWAADASGDELSAAWSCNLDGTEPRQEVPAAAWRIVEEQSGLGKRLVAKPPSVDGGEPIPVLWSMDPIDVWAVWSR